MDEYDVLRWRQAKQLQRLPSGQQISHISGSSSCCFYFQTQIDPEEFLFPYLCSGFRQKPCRKGQSLTNILMEAGRYGCALVQVHTYSDHSHHRYSRHSGWSLLVLKCYRLQHHKQALAFKGCHLIPIFSKQSIIWKQEVREILKMPKYRVSRWLSRLSKHGKDGLINGPSECNLTAFCSVFCPCKSHQPTDMMFSLILKWREGSWKHRELCRWKPLFYWMLHLLMSW